MQPNNECTDANCCKNQQYYKQNAEKRRLQTEKEEIKLQKPLHENNEWGISLDDDGDEQKEVIKELPKIV